LVLGREVFLHFGGFERKSGQMAEGGGMDESLGGWTNVGMGERGEIDEWRLAKLEVDEWFVDE
jgi:hypothetical protein